jgi:hypothetical protein
MRSWTWTAAALALLAVPALAEGPKAPPGWGKPRPKAKVEPQPGDLVSGEVKFKLGDKPYHLEVIKGDISVKDGVFTVLATWRDSEKTEDNFLSKEGQQLQIMFSTAAPGPMVNFMQVIGSYARDEQGVSKIVNASKCAFSATKISAKEFAGKGNCTAGLVDGNGRQARPVTGIEFSGVAK